GRRHPRARRLPPRPGAALGRAVVRPRLRGRADAAAGRTAGAVVTASRRGGHAAFVRLCGGHRSPPGRARRPGRRVGTRRTRRLPRRLRRTGRRARAARPRRRPRAAHRVRGRQGGVRGGLRAGQPAGLGRHPPRGPARRAGPERPVSEPARAAAPPVDLGVQRLVAGRHSDPHRLLGAHAVDGSVVVRAWVPGRADAVTVRFPDRTAEARRVHPAGLWEADAGPAGPGALPPYTLRIEWPGGVVEEREDPYRFWPTVGELDLYLFGEGRHEHLWGALGAHARAHQGVEGVAFAVWAPNAQVVRVVGDWNQWDGRVHPMRQLGSSGVWELFVPAARPGDHYKYELIDAAGHLQLRADPFAAWAEEPPGSASRVFRSSHAWGDGTWLTERTATPPLERPFSVYEVHLGSWRHTPDGRPLSYREVAPLLAAYVTDLGFTHVEFLPLAEHPFGGSWGYQVTSYFAPTA